MTVTTIQHGLAAIDAVFEHARAEKRAAFLPYYPIGYPDYATSLDILQALAEAGADIIEVGVPFSDPLADGPTIQAASQVALKNGITPQLCVQAVAELRQRGVQTPMLLMGYLNPFIAYGVEALTADAQEIGIDGFIIPDMPADEADMVQPLIEAAGLALPHFLAPTSSPTRIRMAARQSRGFIYLVSVTGVTGARSSLPSELVQNVANIRMVTQLPVAIGFGIGTPEQAAMVGQLADAIIVGSALVKAGGISIGAARTLAKGLRDALHPK